ncbi:MAG: methylmalonyl-CoA mutase family protein, partial [Gemmatimonadales bacterium]
ERCLDCLRGAALTADPLAGSYYVEHLTNELERCALALLARVDSLGGAAKAIEASFFQEEIARSAYDYQMRVESREAIVVGVNAYTDGSAPPIVPAPDFSALERDQVERLRAVRAGRDEARARSTLARLRQIAPAYLPAPGAESRARPPLVEPILDAVRARASVGEIADTLRDCWGAYRPA